MSEEMENVSTAAEIEDDGWDDLGYDYDMPEDDTTEKPEADQPKTETGEPTDKKGSEENTQPTDQFVLKHLDDERTVGRDEVIQLAQKGMDYDRIRQKYDESKGKLEEADAYKQFLEELAKAQNTDVASLMDSTRARLLAQKENIDVDAALERVKMDKRTAELDKRAAELDAREKAKSEEDLRTQKRERDISEFMSEYGNDFDIKSIPQEVWLQVSQGKTLLGAYQAYENKQLKAKISEMEQATKNKARTTGSKTESVGNEKVDKWFEGWDDD